LKEPTAQSWPLILRQLLEVGASFHIVTEWKAQDNTVARKRIQSMRRHFHNSKTSLFSQLKADNSTNPGDLLVDDSKESLVRSLGECLKEIELNGNYFGEFSLTVVVHDKSLSAVEKACGRVLQSFLDARWPTLRRKVQPAQRILCDPAGKSAFQPPLSMAVERDLC